MSGTRKIKLPEPLVLGADKVIYRLGMLVRFLLDNHPTFTGGGEHIRLAVRIECAFGLDKSEEEWTEQPELLEADWAKLHAAVESPPPAHCKRCGNPLGFLGYPVKPPILLLPFLDAIKEAAKT